MNINHERVKMTQRRVMTQWYEPRPRVIEEYYEQPLPQEQNRCKHEKNV